MKALTVGELDYTWMQKFDTCVIKFKSHVRYLKRVYDHCILQTNI